MTQLSEDKQKELEDILDYKAYYPNNVSPIHYKLLITHHLNMGDNYGYGGEAIPNPEGVSCVEYCMLVANSKPAMKKQRKQFINILKSNNQTDEITVLEEEDICVKFNFKVVAEVLANLYRYFANTPELWKITNLTKSQININSRIESYSGGYKFREILQLNNNSWHLSDIPKQVQLDIYDILSDCFEDLSYLDKRMRKKARKHSVTHNVDFDLYDDMYEEAWESCCHLDKSDDFGGEILHKLNIASGYSGLHNDFEKVIQLIRRDVAPSLFTFNEVKRDRQEARLKKLAGTIDKTITTYEALDKELEDNLQQLKDKAKYTKETLLEKYDSCIARQTKQEANLVKLKLACEPET